MEHSLAHQIKVGLFTTLGIIAINLSIFFLGGSALFKNQYLLKTRFKQVQGLYEGSVVSLSGIVIGNIKSIEFLGEEDVIELTLKIEEKYKNRITEGSTSDIRTQGALGDRYVYIEPGPAGAKSLDENSILPSIPQTDFLTQFTSQADRANQIFEIIDDLKKVTSALSAENRTVKIMANLEASTQKMNEALGEGKSLLQGLQSEKGTLGKLDRILSKIDRGEGTLGALINDPSLHVQLKNLVGGSSQSSQMKTLLRSSIEKAEK